jgi:hypothetical protein
LVSLQPSPNRVKTKRKRTEMRLSKVRQIPKPDAKHIWSSGLAAQHQPRAR